MTIVNLMYENNKNLFSIPVILTKKRRSSLGGMPGQVAINEWCNVVMYLDTGSNLTSITEKEVKRLNLDERLFKDQRVGGIGGFVDTPTTDEVGIYVMSDKGALPVMLERIAVHPSEIRKKIRKNSGMFVQKGEQTVEMISLFGLDALEKLGGVLEIDMKNKTGKVNI